MVQKLDERPSLEQAKVDRHEGEARARGGRGAAKPRNLRHFDTIEGGEPMYRVGELLQAL